MAIASAAAVVAIVVVVVVVAAAAKQRTMCCGSRLCETIETVVSSAKGAAFSFDSIEERDIHLSTASDECGVLARERSPIA